MTELHQIINSLKDTFNGNAWHGPSVKEVLSKIPTDKTMLRIGNSHSIIELVLHMISWRSFVIHQLQGDNNFKVTDEINFPKGTDWNYSLEELDKSQINLLNALTTFDEQKLQEQVPGKNYSFYKLLHGIVHHDLYHLGQIIMISKQF